MAVKMRCRKVRKLLHTMPECDCEETLRVVSEHLSECEACGALHAGLQRMERAFLKSEFQADEMARRSRIARSPLLKKICTPAKRRAWRLRPVLAGAAVFLLAIGGTSALLLRGGGIKGPGNRGTAMTTKVTAAAAPSQTLEELAEVVYQYEAPSLELPYSPDILSGESFFPTTIQQYLEPGDTIEMIAEATVNLTRREET